MGRSYTPTYRIEYTGKTPIVPMIWSSKDMGRPSESNIGLMLAHMMRSFEPGGVNYGITEETGMLPPLPQSVRVVHQRSGAIVAKWDHPMFCVV